MKRRRVLFVDHAAVLGGAELSLLDLATAYRDTSEVLLFADGPFRERLEAAQVKVKVIPAPQAILSVRSSGGMSAALKALPPLWWMACRIAAVGREFELVHANSQKAFIAAAIATLMGGPAVVWHLRDIVTAPHFSSLNRAIAVFLANRLASQVLVNSRATGEAFIAAGGREDLVTLVYGGIGSDPFDNLASDQSAQIRDQLGIGDAPLVGLFSRLSYWKGQHILLEALQELPNVHALLVGEALFGEAEYTSRLKAMAAAPELAGRVHMLGFRNDVPALMSACDIVVHTSTEPEPFGRVIVEGQLAKRPVVAAAAGGAVELIQDGVTGHLVPPGDPVALAKVIGNLLSDPSAADRLAKEGYIHAKSTFSLESLLMTFDQALNKV
ncbi:MAG: glycosyltransferase family 4 protein [Moorea sp. SIO3I7]|uniref:glycosyltransferase family 4 protein n=1 Tax=unclassified Moorena TaxID=2683338 RepID=UPI0013C08D0F|nr:MULTISPECIES: glycosyltransferase family 4 protein [unclassified Moorena]NEN96981.1 glycosyltransferase family 4 protein [Moorena sp. SIO3I7]NEO05833.1 glycosyltransferase family 4 protein [Moorena sp. SIO3I8]NEO20218.1 glycosyltransferase family 4 protein [Moorena sp. SIO4A5]NEP22665.1 glycosyltransferase family 4 protein [Moorena sp. SIO3I6]